MASSIARKSAENFAVRVFAQVSTLVVGIVIARVLGPGGKGLYSYVTSILTLVTALALGQSSAFAYQLGKQNQPPRVVYAALLRTVAIFAVPMAAGFAIAATVAPSQRLLFAAAASAPLALYAAFANGFFLSASDVRSSNLQNLLMSIISLSAIPLLLVHRALVTVLVVWVASYAAAALFARVRLRRYTRVDKASTIPYSFASQFWFGLKTSMNTLVEELNLRVDMFIILGMLGPRSLGIYSLGIGAAALLWQLSRPIATAAFGRIGSSNEPDAATLTARCMRHSLAFVGVAAVVSFFAAPHLIVLVYGEQFAPAGIVLQLMLPGIVAYCLMPLLATFFAQQLGKPGIPLWLSSVSTIVCAALTAAFIPRYGIAAGAVASSASYAVAVAIGGWLFVRRTRTSWLDLFVFKKEDAFEYSRLLRVR